MLAAAALLYDKFQILLKLQLCLQHIIRCIRWLYLALFRTRRDNNRSSPDSGESKSKALKSTGKQNDQILRNMVHMASYATTCSKFFQIISNCVQKLVIWHPVLIAEIMDVGIYLLDLHPHLWTSVANSPNFTMDVFSPTHKKMYYEFLLTRYFFNSS